MTICESSVITLPVRLSHNSAAQLVPVWPLRRVCEFDRQTCWPLEIKIHANEYRNIARDRFAESKVLFRQLVDRGARDLLSPRFESGVVRCDHSAIPTFRNERTHRSLRTRSSMNRKREFH